MYENRDSLKAMAWWPGRELAVRATGGTKSVVEAHGGFIEVSDNIPSGCIFTFYIEKGEISINE